MTDKNTNLALLLEPFGLTNNDAQVYIFLLERGQSFGGSKIAGRLELHRQYVHNSLQKLLALGLIEEIPSGARTQYKALPPQYITHLAKRQLETAEHAARELSRISAIGADQDFEVYRGVRQIMEFEEQFVQSFPENITQYIIGGNCEAFMDFFGEQYEENSKIAESRGLKSKFIASPSDIPYMERAQSVLSEFEYRVLDTLPKTVVSTVVRFDTVTFYSFANPALLYIIKSKAVAEDYKKFFEMLWDTATLPL